MRYQDKIAFKYSGWVQDRRDPPDWMKLELEIARKRAAASVEAQFAELTREEKEDYYE